LNHDASHWKQTAAAAAGAQDYPAPALYVVATPIGNLADLSLRALHVLGLVDAVACEDSRVTRGLLRHFAIDKPLLALHQHNEREAAAEVLRRLPPLLKTLRDGMASAGMSTEKQDEHIQTLNNSLAAAFTAKAAIISSERIDDLTERLESLDREPALFVGPRCLEGAAEGAGGRRGIGSRAVQPEPPQVDTAPVGGEVEAGPGGLLGRPAPDRPDTDRDRPQWLRLDLEIGPGRPGRLGHAEQRPAQDGQAPRRGAALPHLERVEHGRDREARGRHGTSRGRASGGSALRWLHGHSLPAAVGPGVDATSTRPAGTGRRPPTSASRPG